MNKELAAREWAIKKYPEIVIHAGDFSQDVNYGRRVTHKEAFLAGWEAGQKQLLDGAAKGFEEWREGKILSIVGMSETTAREKLTVYMAPEMVWQAAKLSSAAELAAKDAELAEIKKKTGFTTAFYSRECNNCGHDWSRDD